MTKLKFVKCVAHSVSRVSLFNSCRIYVTSLQFNRCRLSLCAERLMCGFFFSVFFCARVCLFFRGKKKIAKTISLPRPPH